MKALFISMGAWDSIIADESLAKFYGDTTKKLLVETGFLGTLFEVPLYSDFLSHESLRITGATEELFLIPLDKARYFADDYCPLLKEGHDSDGEDIVQLFADSDLPTTPEDLCEVLNLLARKFLVQKRAELELHYKFASTQEAIDYLRGNLQ